MFKGVGIRKTTLVAESLGLKLVFTVTSYDTRDVPISVTVGITLRGNLTLDVERYLEERSWEDETRGGVDHTLHEFEFAIWWNEAYRPVGVEVCQFNTLMELAIIQLYCVPAPLILSNDQLVV